MEVDMDTASTSNAKASPTFHAESHQRHDQNSVKWAPNNRKMTEQELDPKCSVQINKRLVRVEYPGEVKNINKAIETLGGMDSLEASVAEHARKLELHFHPRNKYNKACFADKDFKPGILIKVKKKEPEFAASNDMNPNDVKYDYDVEGASVINFSFNRLCDFQYLPLISQQPESKSSKTDFIYEKILPSLLPNSDWLESEESKNMEQFLLPVSFSRHDSAQSKVHVDTNDKNEPKPKGNTVKLNSKQQKSVCRIFRKAKQQISVFVNFKDREIPTQPLENAVKLLKHRNLENRIGKVKQERPIWTKAAIRHITGLTDEHSKVVLPVVAYYFTNGPWRITWVKFGYDPRTDPKARIYQTLDYRIRTGESTKLKVSAKRSYAGKTSLFLAQSLGKKVSLKNDMSAKPKLELDERYYVLRPFTIPPARQMFYQFCDLLLPEIQDMISRLPENNGSFCHPKDGFLPDNFIEKSRQVVNEYVLEAVQKELLEDKKILQEKVSSKEKGTKDGTSHLDYYNQMLSKIKKGIYTNVEVPPSQINRDLESDEIELISLSSDDEDDYAVDKIIQSSIPETLDAEDNSDESDFSDDAEIDMEAVQEINEMLSHLNEKT